MGELSGWHWLIVIGVAVLLFGARRLPDAARALGQSTRILKAELHAPGPAPSPPGAPAPGSAGDAAPGGRLDAAPGDGPTTAETGQAAHASVDDPRR